MTPRALTPAASRLKQSGSAATTAKTAHRRPLRRGPAPNAPRRVSGPLRTPANAAVGGATMPSRAPRTMPSRSRRRSRPGASRRPLLASLPERAGNFISTLPDHRLLDRVVRGRTWIVLLGVLLAGIVAMQVEMLKLNANIGNSIDLGTALQSRNEILRASVSSLSDSQRIERLAAGMGMVMPGPTSVGFLDARTIKPAQAAANIHAPDPSAFEAELQATNAGGITPLGGGADGTLAASPTEATSSTTTAPSGAGP